MMTMKRVAAVSVLAFGATVVALAQTPNVIFHDDFSQPTELDTGWDVGGIGPILIPSEEIWGPGSTDNRGAWDQQWIQVKNQNSEFYFGEPNNSYLEIQASGLDPESIWLTAVNRFSEPSEVVTVSLRFYEPGTIDDGGPRIRLGAGNAVFNGQRARQDTEFDTGNFSGKSDVYSTDESHLLELVYNNSSETVTYIDGQVALRSDTYDVWIDGNLVMQSHSFATGSTSIPVGQGLQSLAIVVFGADRNTLYIDDVTVYDGPYIQSPGTIPEQPEEGLLFADDFSAPEPNGLPSFEIWGEDAVTNRGPAETQWVRVTNANSEEYFGEPNNNYLELYSLGGNGADSVWISAKNKFFYPSSVVTVSLDFYRSPSGSLGPTMRVGVNDPISSNTNRARYQFRFEENALSGGNTVVQDGQRYHLEMVYNNSEAPVTYAEGTATVLPDSYDIWIDGELMVSGVQYGPYDSTRVPLGASMTSWGLGIFGTAQNELRIDNLKIYEGGRVSGTAGGGAVTFAEWVASEGISVEQSGLLDAPAGDGIPNLIKFALGLPALTPSRADLPAPQRVVEGGEEHLALEFVLPADRVGVQLLLQGAEELGGEWTDLEVTPEVLDAGAEGGQLVRLLDPEPMSAHDRRFLRLRVNYVE